MECPLHRPETAEVLLDYCRRRLDAGILALLEKHMLSCDDCRAFSEAQMSVWAALDAWDPEPVSQDFNRRLWARIDEDAAREWWRPLKDWLRPAAPLAAVAVGLMAVFLVRVPPPPQPPSARTETVEVEQVEHALEDVEMLRVLQGPAQTI